MSNQPRAIPYLLVGHVAKDLTPSGARLGGTVAYAGLTADALGAQVGIVTTCGQDIELKSLSHIELITHSSDATTTFINREGPSGRSQRIQARAEPLSMDMIPPTWRDAEIVHLAPIADEIDQSIADMLPKNSLCLTPQGWLRKWDVRGDVERKHWSSIAELLASAHAVVCSMEDLGHDPSAPNQMGDHIPILVVTRGQYGAWLFVDGTKSNIAGEAVNEVDPTGSGDIFSAAFFWDLYQGQDPYRAAQFANKLAARSVTRAGLDAVPTHSEIEALRGSL
jgi:sugar/nucleoside kinase (ribokinase family)